MKRIIIPAGTVSGKQDYILEIPIDSNDQDENAIYILDDKSSKGSMRSLSDYFYDKDSRSQLNQDCMKQFLYQQCQEQEPHTYQNDDLLYSYPSSYMLKQEFKPATYQRVENPNLPDISQSANYYYYKSLGFTESELHKLLAKNAPGQRRVSKVPSQRKQMRFNRLGVSDFTLLGEDQNPNLYQYDSYIKQMSAPVGNVGRYGNMMTNTAYPNIPYNASASFERTQGYYEDYPREKQSDVPKIDARMYKQYNAPIRPSVSPTGNNMVRRNQSYTLQQNSSAPPAGSNQMQHAYYQPRFYPKAPPSPNVGSASKTPVPNVGTKNQSSTNENHENMGRTMSPDGSVLSNTKMENYQKTSQSFSRQIPEIQKTIYRTLPGTSVVSNVPNIRIRNPVAS